MVATALLCLALCSRFSFGRGEIGLGEEKKADLQNRYLSPDLEFDDQPSYPNTQ
jgi:hypothetical protein